MELSAISDIVQTLPWLAEFASARQAEPQPVWLVGGSVRDLLLGRTPLDIDLAAPDPEPLARRFAGLIGGRVIPLDPERGTWRVTLAPQHYVDFCRFRAQDILGDLRGRDFTCNAIAIRLPDDDSQPLAYYDPFHGADDLRTNTLRMVEVGAFRDDPARILRAFRFLAELPLTIEPLTLLQVRRDADRLPLVAPERLLSEWWRLCAAPRAETAIRLMADTGVLDVLFPEVAATRGVTQNAYHRLDVWGHQLLAVEKMASLLAHPGEALLDLMPEFDAILRDPHRCARLLFLALVHDIGKPATRSVVEGRTHFYEHDAVGAEQVSALCRRMRVSRDDTRVMETVVRHHLRPLHLSHAKTLSRKAMIKFFGDTGDAAWEVMLLALADKAAGQGPAAEPDILAQLRAVYRQLLAFYHTIYQPALTHPYVTGRDLIRQFDIPPGPTVGSLLQQLRHLQLTGQVSSVEEAIHWLTKHGHASIPQPDSTIE
ncbi:MAG TPA: HD domain-containing protein [Armatimonadota bacterium]|jgi:tRNA nucleotidyltransferase/poly(A) polymerase